jgi:hypothetical protein
MQGKLNLRNVMNCSAYYRGARAAILKLVNEYQVRIPEQEKVYDNAFFKLITASLDNTRRFIDGQQIRYRNHERNKRGKLVKCEAYFVEYGKTH